MQGYLGITSWAQPALVLGQSGCVQRGIQALFMICSAAAAITQDDVILLHVSILSPTDQNPCCGVQTAATVTLKYTSVVSQLEACRALLPTHFIGLCIRTLGAEDPFLVNLPILIKVPGKDLAVATGDLALLDGLPNAQLALLNLQHMTHIFIQWNLLPVSPGQLICHKGKAEL